MVLQGYLPNASRGDNQRLQSVSAGCPAEILWGKKLNHIKYRLYNNSCSLVKRESVKGKNWSSYYFINRWTTPFPRRLSSIVMACQMDSWRPWSFTRSLRSWNASRPSQTTNRSWLSSWCRKESAPPCTPMDQTTSAPPRQEPCWITPSQTETGWFIRAEACAPCPD